MTKEEHIERHKKLHRALDELFADWIENSGEERPFPKEHTIWELIEWSYQQTKNPAPDKNDSSEAPPQIQGSNLARKASGVVALAIITLMLNGCGTGSKSAARSEPRPTPAPRPKTESRQSATRLASAPVPSIATPSPLPAAFRNNSGRGRVDRKNPLYGGFILENQSCKVLIRALGPSTKLVGALADPIVELRNAAGALVASNDDWKENEAEVRATGQPPADDREAALVATLVPGSYVASARVKGMATGTVLLQSSILTTPEPIPTPTPTPSPTTTPVPTATPTATATPSLTPSPTGTPTVTPTSTPGVVHVEWSTVLGVTGYRVVWGTTSKAYSKSFEVSGNITQVEISGITGVNYFAVISVGQGGVVSVPSNEVKYP